MNNIQKNQFLTIILIAIFTLGVGTALYFLWDKEKQSPGQDVEDLIEVTNPRRNATVESPLMIEGRARGTWYFEASFPVQLLDASGAVLGTAVAQAQGDWMTEDFVPFKAQITFDVPLETEGTLVFHKDNPSGLPQHDAEFRVPVRLKPSPTQQRPVTLYYYNPEKDKDEDGNLLCSRQGLVGVQRYIPSQTDTPIHDAINLLLKGQLTSAEREQGITTEFQLPQFELRSVSLKNGTLALEFADPLGKTSGGSCRAGILWFQIEATAKQFENVASVKFTPDTLFQP